MIPLLFSKHDEVSSVKKSNGASTAHQAAYSNHILGRYLESAERTKCQNDKIGVHSSIVYQIRQHESPHNMHSYLTSTSQASLAHATLHMDSAELDPNSCKLISRKRLTQLMLIQSLYKAENM
jgi:hypothetical protein